MAVQFNPVDPNNIIKDFKKQLDTISNAIQPFEENMGREFFVINNEVTIIDPKLLEQWVTKKPSINTAKTISQFEKVLDILDKDKNKNLLKDIGKEKLSEWQKKIDMMSSYERMGYHSGIKGLFLRIGSAISSFFSGHGLTSIGHRGQDAVNKAGGLLGNLITEEKRIHREEDKQVREKYKQVREKYKQVQHVKTCLAGTGEENKFEYVDTKLVSSAFVQDIPRGDFSFIVNEAEIRCTADERNGNVGEIVTKLKDAGISDQEVKNITSLANQGMNRDLIGKINKQEMKTKNRTVTANTPKFVIEKNDDSWVISVEVKGVFKKIDGSGEEGSISFKRTVTISEEDFKKDWTKNSGTLQVVDVVKSEG